MGLGRAAEAGGALMNPLPSQARVVVIGGGVIGCSVAYHLAQMGCRDVLLLERDRLTSGTTWHAAGLMVTFGSTSATATELRQYSRSLYARLEAETGQATGLRQCGFIEAAADADRLEEFRRVAAFNRHCGVEVHEISPREVGELFPLARTDDLLAGFYVPDDGRVNPVDVTMALAKGARQRGARLVEGVPVLDVKHERGRVTGVRTAVGDVACEVVVNCAGMWARELGARSGVVIPNQAAEHYYLITEPIAGVSRDWPVLEDPGAYGYYREEGGGLMVGLFEPEAAAWGVDGIPPAFGFGEITPDWDRMAPFLERAMSRVLCTATAGIRKFFCGPESFTPDLNPIVGEAPELTNYFVAAGLNSIGILSGGGIGRILAHWIVNGRPDVDVSAIHVDRLQPYQANPAYRRARVAEALGLVYRCHYPTLRPQTARGAKRSPLHDRLAAAGAHFRDVSGWEAADWYAPPGVAPKVERLSWGRPDWFPYWAAEHRAVRDNAGLIDMSFMSKFLVQGRDAAAALERLSANRVSGISGRITYTQWLNDDGRLEADLTVTQLDEERFLVVATDTAHRHVQAWMRRHFAPDAHVFVADLSGAWAQLNLQGPRSRALLQTLTAADLSNTAFPFRAAREIDLGYARVLAVRITYVGELGWELVVPVEQALHVHECLVEAGRAFGLAPVGLKALASLRLEKGYRDYGHDIDNTDDAWEAGLGFALALDKPGGFIGRDAAVAQRAAGPPHRRLLQIQLLDPEPLLFHAEVVWRDGVRVGYLRSASYGHTLGGAVGLAMIDAGQPLDAAWIAAGRWEVEVVGRRVAAKASLQPLYDPAMTRVRG